MPVTVVLHVAEKPSVARAVALVLSRAPAGGSPPGGGRAGGAPPVWEFDATWPPYGAGVRHLVTSVAGHLMELEFAPPYSSWQSCLPSALFDAPIMRSVPAENEAIAAQLRGRARTAQALVLWLDCDREGEAIAYEVIEVCTGAAACGGAAARAATGEGGGRRGCSRVQPHPAPPPPPLAALPPRRRRRQSAAGAAPRQVQRHHGDGH